jgi:mannose-6-phosphate isomerase-like protein (cupin superfamily)
MSTMPDLEIRRWPDDKTIDQENVAEIWARDGFSCDLWVDPPGQQWLDFVHQTDERVIVKEGRIEFDVDGSRAILEPGDEVFIPAGSRHSVWNRGSTTARWFYGYKHH